MRVVWSTPPSVIFRIVEIRPPATTGAAEDVAFKAPSMNANPAIITIDDFILLFPIKSRCCVL